MRIWVSRVVLGDGSIELTVLRLNCMDGLQFRRSSKVKPSYLTSQIVYKIVL